MDFIVAGFLAMMGVFCLYEKRIKISFKDISPTERQFKILKGKNAAFVGFLLLSALPLSMLGEMIGILSWHTFIAITLIFFLTLFLRSEFEVVSNASLDAKGWPVKDEPPKNV